MILNHCSALLISTLHRAEHILTPRKSTVNFLYFIFRLQVITMAKDKYDFWLSICPSIRPILVTARSQESLQVINWLDFGVKSQRSRSLWPHKTWLFAFAHQFIWSMWYSFIHKRLTGWKQLSFEMLCPKGQRSTCHCDIVIFWKQCSSLTGGWSKTQTVP